MANTLDLSRQDDDGFVGLDTVKPSAPDDSMHFMDQIPAETFSLPIPGSDKIEKSRVAGSQKWSVHTSMLGAPGSSLNGATKLCGARRGRRSVDVVVGPNATVYISEGAFPIPVAGSIPPDCLPLINTTTNNLIYNLPTEGAIYGAVIAGNQYPISVVEYYDE